MVVPKARAGWLSSGNVRGALWLIGAALFMTGMSTLAKIIAAEQHFLEVAFARAFFGLIAILPLMLRRGPAIWRTAHPVMHLGRGLLGASAMLCGFYAVTHMPLAEATALGFTKPLFMIVLAALVLREYVGPRRWTATGIGFLGVLIMLRPGVGVIDFAAFVAIAGAFFAAWVAVLIKRLTASEGHATILFYFGIITALATGLPMIAVWQTPTVHELVLMISMGLVGTAGQLCLLQAFKVGEASALAPLDYMRLPFAAMFGLAVFGEWPDGFALLGAVVIAASTLYIARREAQLARLKERAG